MGRFMTPDWAAGAVTVPYASLGDPQSLNLYTYVENGPLNRVDAMGHDVEVCFRGECRTGADNTLLADEQWVNGICIKEEIGCSFDITGGDKPNGTIFCDNDPCGTVRWFDPAAQNNCCFWDIPALNGIPKEIGNAIDGLFNLGNDIASALSGKHDVPDIPEAQSSSPAEGAVMEATAVFMLVIPESKASELEKVGVALREEKIVQEAEKVAEYSDGALMRSARKATAQVEKHLDLLKKSGSEAARSIKVDLRHNAERLEAIIREAIRRTPPSP
jgi:hypothetical protein